LNKGEHDKESERKDIARVENIKMRRSTGGGAVIDDGERK
jgi:lipoate-protein ligase A